MVNYEHLYPEFIRCDDAEDINHLLAQLTDNPTPINTERLVEICTNAMTCVARDSNGHIVAMGTLSVRDIPTGKVGLLDDVVVDSSMRGRGIGRLIVKDLMKVAKTRRVSLLELTCRPTRTEANFLYEGLGFKSSPTNRYVIKF